jgi:hypothetical protein
MVSLAQSGRIPAAINQYGNDWDRPGLEKCAHAFVGRFADGLVGTVQTLPWNRRGWHCGRGKNGSANDTHISFEICEDGLEDARDVWQITSIKIRGHGFENKSKKEITQ